MMKSVMIDMDDVLINNCFLDIISDFLGYSVDINNIKTYYIQDILGDKKDEFFKYFKTVNLYEKAKLLDDCYDVIKLLNDKYNVFICTSYIWKEMLDNCGNILKYKYDFLTNNFPFINPYNYIFSSFKDIINFNIKIDDKIDNLENADIKLLYTAYHNKDVSEKYLKEHNIIRVDNWLDIKKVLLEEV